MCVVAAVLAQVTQARAVGEAVPAEVLGQPLGHLEVGDAGRAVQPDGRDLGDREPQTLSQAGRKLGVSTERARQIEERALKRLSQRPELIALREAA